MNPTQIINYFYLSILIFPFAYAFFLKKPNSFLVRLLLGTIIYWGVNSAYFFIAYLLNLKLDLAFVFVLQLLYLIGLWLINRNGKKISLLENFQEDLGLILVVLSIFTIFILSSLSFKNGKRLPIFSYTQDAANHFLITKSIYETGKISGLYPQAFHANIWIFEKIAGLLDEEHMHDSVLFVNVFSIVLIFIACIYGGSVYLVSKELINNEYRGRASDLLLAMLTITIGLLTCYYFIADGFLSNWFNHVFLFGIFLTLLFYNQNDTIFGYVLVPLVFGFAYSYIFFLPVLVIFLALESIKKRRMIYVFSVCTLISVLIFLAYFLKNMFGIGISSVAIASGVFVNFSIEQIALYTVFAIFFLINSQKWKQSEKIVRFCTIFFIYSFSLLIFQIITTGSAQYAFYKSFSSVVVILGILCVSQIGEIFNKILFRCKTNLEVYWLVIFLTGYALFQITPLISSYSMVDIASGKFNFFQNNKEKYNSVIYTIENLRNYNKYIYVDQDFSSSQWAYTGFLNDAFDTINRNTANGFNASVGDMFEYTKTLNTIGHKETLLVVDPTRYLEVNCNAEFFIHQLLTSKAKIYPAFDLSHRLKNCKQ